VEAAAAAVEAGKQNAFFIIGQLIVAECKDRLYSTAMKLTIVGLVAALVGFASAHSAVQKPKQIGSGEDEAAVRTLILHWQRSWEHFDASVLQGDYAEDADWLNAFGVRIKGGARIVEFVSKVVKRPNVQGRQTTWDEPVIRFVRPDVAVAYRDYRTVGHKTPDGKEMPQRNTHSTWLLTKDGEKWLIASQVISDDNAAAVPVPKEFPAARSLGSEIKR
jgi:uncharacterized protein (TIGR02246 family)